MAWLPPPTRSFGFAQDDAVEREPPALRCAGFSLTPVLSRWERGKDAAAPNG